jgi:hypothetical protein
MSITDVLSRRPRTLPPTLPLSRVRDYARGTILVDAPLFLASHWRNGRSFPCLEKILPSCPYCSGCEQRHHAYVACVLNSGGTHTSIVILELSARCFPLEEHLYGKHFTASRRGKRSPVDVEISDRQSDEPAPPPRREQRETLRTIAKVYALPDPVAYDTEKEWLAAVKIRVLDPDYSPGKSTHV